MHVKLLLYRTFLGKEWNFKTKYVLEKILEGLFLSKNKTMKFIKVSKVRYKMHLYGKGISKLYI